jgi:hypothetical protein
MSATEKADATSRREEATRDCPRSLPEAALRYSAHEEKKRRANGTERANITFLPLWQKKVDNAIFRDSGAMVPNWVCDIRGSSSAFSQLK